MMAIRAHLNRLNRDTVKDGRLSLPRPPGRRNPVEVSGRSKRRNRLKKSAGGNSRKGEGTAFEGDGHVGSLGATPRRIILAQATSWLRRPSPPYLSLLALALRDDLAEPRPTRTSQADASGDHNDAEDLYRLRGSTGLTLANRRRPLGMTSRATRMNG